MSFDYNSTRRPCNHQILMERYTVDTFDFRTLRLVAMPSIGLRGPINGAQFVQLYVGGQLVNRDHPIYGYDIVRDPNRVDQDVDAIFYDLIFRKKVRFASALLIELSYVTLKPFCLKCGGLGFNNDWTVAPGGGLEKVHDVPKLAQQCLKYILASSVPFNQNLACALRSYINSKMTMGISDQDISAEVTRVLGSYKQIQAAQQTVQHVTAQEVLKDITQVETDTDPNNPNRINLTVQVQGYGGTQPVPLNVTLQTS